MHTTFSTGGFAPAPPSRKCHLHPQWPAACRADALAPPPLQLGSPEAAFPCPRRIPASITGAAACHAQRCKSCQRRHADGHQAHDGEGGGVRGHRQMMRGMSPSVCAVFGAASGLGRGQEYGVVLPGMWPTDCPGRTPPCPFQPLSSHPAPTIPLSRRQPTSARARQRTPPAGGTTRWQPRGTPTSPRPSGGTQTWPCTASWPPPWRWRRAPSRPWRCSAGGQSAGRGVRFAQDLFGGGGKAQVGECGTGVRMILSAGTCRAVSPHHFASPPPWLPSAQLPGGGGAGAHRAAL